MKIVVKTTKTISFDENCDDDDGSSSENKSEDRINKEMEGSLSDKNDSQSEHDLQDAK